MVMDKQAEIPCANCDSWKRKEKKFSCNPDACKVLTSWFLDNMPQLKTGEIPMQVHVREVAIQYVV